MRPATSFATFVEQRRQALGAGRVPQGASQIWGLALSGGGIRSATFCLGLLRALARRGMLLRFDAFSTVSGGGYTGSTLGRLLSRARTPDDVVAVERGFADADARWFTWWLRANGRYLIPRGAKDTTFAIATYLRNLTAVHIELGLMALLLGVVLVCIDIVGWGGVSLLGYTFGESFFRAARYLPAWLPVIVLLLPLPVFAGAVVASAYWCIPWLTSSQTERKRPLLYWAGAIGFVVALLLVRMPLMSIPTEVGESLRTALWWSSMFVVAAWLVSLPVATHVLREAAVGAPHLEADRARNRLTRWLANVMRAGVLLALLGLVDRFAWYLAFEVSGSAQVSAGVALAVAAAVGRALLPLLGSVAGARRTTGAMLFVGRLVGFALTFLLVAWWVSLLQRAALGAAFQRLVPRFPDSVTVLLVIGLPTLTYLVLTGRSLSFLNLSSLHAFYRARLVRSYLGAANGARFHANPLDPLPQPMPADPAFVSVDSLADDDDIAFRAYAPQRHGGPIHIVNVCVNQTRDPRGGLYNQDRRGLLMSVASTGQMRVSQQAWSPMPEGNALTLGTWTAISGAAVAPGLGSLSRGGISALAMFAGLRLGYWWRPVHFAGRLPLLAKSYGLLRETFGIFRGTERPDWFLTDGGHFENTGAYALLAERAQVIVIADCGADPQYAFSDIENLVRKARIDLQAEILFQRPKVVNDAEAVATGVAAAADAPPSPPWPSELEAFGSLNDLASPKSSACLALARINYGGEHPATGLLIVVKPNVSAGLPVDLVNFKVQNPAFPQETTADQFFSEAQWESYFQLGQFLGGKLTRPFVESLPANWEMWFEADESSPFDAPAAEAAEATRDAAEASGRLPARIRLATVGAGISLGAAATAAVSAWQAIDSYRTASAKQVADERAALKELTELWARVPPSPSAPGAPAAINTLAAAIVRTADTLCPTHEAGWFQRSALAEKIHTAALQQCRALKDTVRDGVPQACATLLEAAQPALQSRLPDCLAAPEEASESFAPPRYWVFDYSTDAPFARAHPCDAAAWERRRAAEAYRLAASRRDPAAPPAKAPIEQAPSECSDASLLDRLDAAFTGAVGPPSGTVVAARAPASVESPPAAASPESSPASTVTPASAPAATQAVRERSCAGKTIYIQIYGPAQRDEVRRFKDPWRALGASVPPIEDVSATAAAAGRAPPTPVVATTVRAHDADSRACADALADAVHQAGWVVEPLSSRLKAIPGVIEVWVPPPRGAS